MSQSFRQITASVAGVVQIQQLGQLPAPLPGRRHPHAPEKSWSMALPLPARSTVASGQVFDLLFQTAILWSQPRKFIQLVCLVS